MGNAVNSDPKSASEGQSQPFDDSNSEDGSRDEETFRRRIKKHESFRLQRTPIAPRVTPSPARVDVAATTDGKDGSQPAGEDRAAGRVKEAEELASESSDDDSVGPVEVALRGTAQYTSFILTRPGNNGACIGKEREQPPQKSTTETALAPQSRDNKPSKTYSSMCCCI